MLDRINANISQHMKEMNERVGEAESRIMAVENTSAEMEKQIAGLSKVVKELTVRMQDYENRGRRKNLRILGIKEELEGRDVVTFMEKWIPRILDMEMKADRVKLERAHRVPGPAASRLL